MIPLQLKQNVISPSGPWPFGQTKDNTGIGDGTPLNNAVLTDYMQFFAKMFALSGITPNNLQDNNTNGFQYVDALLKVINSYQASVFYFANTTLTQADIGKLVVNIASGNVNYTLPLAVTFNLNEKLRIINGSPNQVTIIPQGSDILNPTPIKLNLYDSVELTPLLNGSWVVTQISIYNPTPTIVAASLLTGYTGSVNYARSICKDKVDLQGSVVSPGTPGVGDIIFNLPAGFRPATTKNIASIFSYSGGVVSFNLRIQTNGDVLVLFGPTISGVATFYLDGISFYVNW